MSNVFARLTLQAIRERSSSALDHERDASWLLRTMTVLRLDFARLVADRGLAALVAASVGRTRGWLLGVAAEHGFLTPEGCARLRTRNQERRPRAPKGRPST